MLLCGTTQRQDAAPPCSVGATPPENAACRLTANSKELGSDSAQQGLTTLSGEGNEDRQTDRQTRLSERSSGSRAAAEASDCSEGSPEQHGSASAEMRRTRGVCMWLIFTCSDITQNCVKAQTVTSIKSSFTGKITKQWKQTTLHVSNVLNQLGSVSMNPSYHVKFATRCPKAAPQALFCFGGSLHLPLRVEGPGLEGTQLLERVLGSQFPGAFYSSQHREELSKARLTPPGAQLCPPNKGRRRRSPQSRVNVSWRLEEAVAGGRGTTHGAPSGRRPDVGSMSQE